VIAQGSSSAGRSSGGNTKQATPRAGLAVTAAAVLRKTHKTVSFSNAEDSYDFEEAAAAPMHALPGSRIELEATCDMDEQPLYGGTFDATHYDSQNWEEMTSLLSFDGEEHKYVMR
jgi:hypothetical protein